MSQERRTYATAVRTAMKIAASYRDQLTSQWIVSTGTTGGSCGHINFSNSWTSASTSDWEINPQVWRYIAHYTEELTSRKKSIEQPRLNHHGIIVRSSDRGNMFSDISQQEMLALQLLRKMVDQESFRKYLRHGFVPVRGASGLVYQVDRRNRIKVWERGELLAELCVHLRGNCPPTDEVVGKILIIEYNEADIWKRSNITWSTDNRNRRSLELIGQASNNNMPHIIISGAHDVFIAAGGAR